MPSSPVLARVGPAGHVGEPLERPEDRGEEDALAAEDARHVGAEGRRQRDDDDDEDGDLEPALAPSELLPAHQRVDQVGADQRRDDQAEESAPDRRQRHIRSIRSIAQ